MRYDSRRVIGGGAGSWKLRNINAIRSRGLIQAFHLMAYRKVTAGAVGEEFDPNGVGIKIIER